MVRQGFADTLMAPLPYPRNSPWCLGSCDTLRSRLRLLGERMDIPRCELECCEHLGSKGQPARGQDRARIYAPLSMIDAPVSRHR